ncbi:MAG: hypothetical protein WA435_06680 [Gallionellaceae bacterium]
MECWAIASISSEVDLIMSLLICQENGFPYLIDSNDLPRTEDSKLLERITEIAVAFERAGIDDGIHVQCIQVEYGRFVHAVNTFDGSFGAILLMHLVDRMIAQNKLYSVKAALHFAKATQEYEARHEQVN